MKPGSKFWIACNGEKVFGKGPCELLKTVDKLESLNKAAKQLNMSYSKAWLIIKRSEKLLGYSLLETVRGGQDGGGSYLTEEARALMESYEKFNEEAKKSVEQIYNKIFEEA